MSCGLWSQRHFRLQTFTRTVCPAPPARHSVSSLGSGGCLGVRSQTLWNAEDGRAYAQVARRPAGTQEQCYGVVSLGPSFSAASPGLPSAHRSHVQCSSQRAGASRTLCCAWLSHVCHQNRVTEGHSEENSDGAFPACRDRAFSGSAPAERELCGFPRLRPPQEHLGTVPQGKKKGKLLVFQMVALIMVFSLNQPAATYF